MKKKHFFLVKFGENLRALRKSKGFNSQESLADACKLDRTYISAIERGEINVSLLNLALIAYTLKVEISDLAPKIKNFRE